uniref:Uncharacterized protein n=1 Tax=Anguilla anguilla TaxID=7936 RepID=A0A0E9UU45_ANGAN
MELKRSSFTLLSHSMSHVVHNLQVSSTGKLS